MNEMAFNVSTSDGFVLRAIASIPERPKKVVVMCHGISSHKKEYLDMFVLLAERLFRNDIASVRFDYRGHGESSGNSLDFGVVAQLIDVDTIVRWIKNEPSLSHCNLSYVGVSFGGAPGVFYQSIYGVFSKLSLFAPVISYIDTFVEPTTPWGRANFSASAWDAARTKGYLTLDGQFRVGIALLSEFLLLDPMLKLPDIGVPVQIFHGTNDSLVPCSVAERLVGKFKNIDVKIVHDMGHGLYIGDDECGLTSGSIKIQEIYYNDVVSFLNE